MSYLSNYYMSDYSKNYREIMKILYDRINERSSDIIKTYNETKDKIILETKFETIIEIEKNTYSHIDVVIESTRNKIRMDISNYRRAVMQYLSGEEDGDQTKSLLDPVDEVRKAANGLLTDQEILKELISQKQMGKLYVSVDKIGEGDNQVIYDLSNKTKTMEEQMDEQLIEGEATLMKEIKKSMVAKKAVVSDKQFKQFLFKTLEECNAYPSKTNNALSKEDMVKIIQNSMHKGSYKNMPKGYKSRSKKEICSLLFEFKE